MPTNIHIVKLWFSQLSCMDVGPQRKLKWSEVKSLSRVQLFATPWTVIYQVSLSIRFSRHRYWSGLPFPSLKEGWVLRNSCFWTVMLETTLESCFDSKKIKLINRKGNQHWIFIGRTEAEAEEPILWPPDAESTHWKRPWCWERLRVGGVVGDKGRNGWMASLT